MVIPSLTCEDHIAAKHRSSSVNKQFPCDECHLVLANFNLLQNHNNKYHPIANNDELFQCEQCKTILQDSSALETHKMDYHNGNQFPCDECEFSSDMYTEVWKHKFITHDMGKGQNMDPAELFMNVLAAQQDFIVNQLEQSEKRWETELKGIQNNQNKLFNEVKALNKNVLNKQSVPNEALKDAIDVLNSKVEIVLQTVEKQSIKEASNTNTGQQKKKLLFVGDSLSRNLN